MVKFRHMSFHEKIFSRQKLQDPDERVLGVNQNGTSNSIHGVASFEITFARNLLDDKEIQSLTGLIEEDSCEVNNEAVETLKNYKILIK